MLSLDALIQTGIVAMSTGFGSAIGQFLAARSVLRHFDKNK